MISHCRGLLFLQPVHLKLHKIWANIQKVGVYVTGNLKGNLHRILLWYFFMQLHWKMKAQWSRAGNFSSEVHNSNRIRSEGIRQWAYQIHECTMQIYSKCCKLGERDAAIHMSIMNLELSPAFSYLSILKVIYCIHQESGPSLSNLAFTRLACLWLLFSWKIVWVAFACWEIMFWHQIKEFTLVLTLFHLQEEESNLV
jgi:hypothetical protein